MLTYNNPPIAEWRMLIDGELVPSSSGAVFDNINPATEEVIGVTADGTREDFRRAVGRGAARVRQDRLVARRRLPRPLPAPAPRRALVRHDEEIRPLLVTEVGTPVWLTRDTLFDVPIERLLRLCRPGGETIPTTTELPDVDFRGVVSKRRIRHEPMGVVAAIIALERAVGLGPRQARARRSPPAARSCSSRRPTRPGRRTILGQLIAEETDIPPGVVNVVTALGQSRRRSADHRSARRHDRLHRLGAQRPAHRRGRVRRRSSGCCSSSAASRPIVVLESADVAAAGGRSRPS